MSKVEEFLRKEDEQAIIDAICMAEKATSGEVRVHIEKTTSLKPFDRALEIFYNLKMNETKDQNGVLIYLAIDDHAFAICGDKGINDLVSADFWDNTKTTMANHFRNGNFKQGLIDGILEAGNQLQKYFPYQDSDSNELSNEISKG